MRKLGATARLAAIRQLVWRLTVEDSSMAEPPANNATVVNTAKVAGILALLPTLFSSLPPTVALTICITMVTCAAITASVPAPTNNRVLIALYQVVRVIGLGVSYALPYVATHLVKGGPSVSTAPQAVPASVGTNPQDDTK
ncbi:hypothetical protein [Acetobacter ghanensis]|nr:hypothetical protein [Acetobacter ghanensis]NHO40261.1 hypothetical protein [Acetobacter ghanensis]GBQ50690.1 hypothetical protein AA18895_1994 [Acetobacter ghanensis DSM 18895]